MALVFADEGRNWEYLATIAGADAVPGAGEGFDEPCLSQLEDGDLMCISRVGSGRDQCLARAYSGDGGRHWSAVDRLEAWSVAPQICRLDNGVLALSTGRPGVFVWLATDARGTTWGSVDVLAHHNAVLEPAAHVEATQTTAYTAMVQASPDRLFVAYDRTPLGWQPVAADAGQRSQIYLFEIAVERA